MEDVNKQIETIRNMKNEGIVIEQSEEAQHEVSILQNKVSEQTNICSVYITLYLY